MVYAMELAETFGIASAGDSIVPDFDGLLSEVLLVGVILTVYLVGVATDQDGRKI